MNICVNIFGQIKYQEQLKQTIQTSLLDNNNTFHFLFTTWNSTDETPIKNLFPNCFVKKYELPNLLNYSKIIDNYTLDKTQRSNKDITHYVYGFYIKSKSHDTIIEYENLCNIKFDIILTARTYTNLFGYKLQDYYNHFKEDIVYSAEDPCFAIYGMDAYPDSFVMSRRDVGLQILNVFDVLEKCTIDNCKTFHPETTSFRIIKEKGYTLEKLPFRAFVFE